MLEFITDNHIVLDTITAVISCIATVVTMCIAVFQIPKVVRNQKRQLANLTLYGDKAIQFYNKMHDVWDKATADNIEKYRWESKWQGEKPSDFDYMLEIRGIDYDPKVFGSEWDDCFYSVRYVYLSESNEKYIRGWRLREYPYKHR